jgi:hypothetical protein
VDVDAPRPEVETQGRTVTLRFPSSWPCLARAHGEVALNVAFEWELFMRGLGAGAAQMRADLADVSVRALDILGGATGVDLRLGAPPGCVPIRIVGDATDVAIHRPPNVAVRLIVRGEGTNLRVDGNEVDSGGVPTRWTSAPCEGATGLYDVTVEGRATRMVVDQGDSASAV